MFGIPIALTKSDRPAGNIPPPPKQFLMFEDGGEMHYEDTQKIEREGI